MDTEKLSLHAQHYTSQLKLQHGYISSSEALVLAEEQLTLNGSGGGDESFLFGSMAICQLQML